MVFIFEIIKGVKPNSVMKELAKPNYKTEKTFSLPNPREELAFKVTSFVKTLKPL